VTEVEAEEARRPWIFYYGLETSATLSTIAVALVPSLLVPLLLPAGALFLFLRLHTDKYNLLFMHPHTPSSSCRIATTTVRLLDIIILLFQATGCAIVGTLGTNGQFIALAILLCVSVGHSIPGCGMCVGKRRRFIPTGRSSSGSGGGTAGSVMEAMGLDSLDSVGSPRRAAEGGTGDEDEDESDESDEDDMDEDEDGDDGSGKVDDMEGVSSSLLGSMAMATARSTGLYKHGYEFEYDALGLQYPRYEQPTALPPALGGR
jgi:hypothetical protein